MKGSSRERLEQCLKLIREKVEEVKIAIATETPEMSEMHEETPEMPDTPDTPDIPEIPQLPSIEPFQEIEAVARKIAEDKEVFQRQKAVLEDAQDAIRRATLFAQERFEAAKRQLEEDMQASAANQHKIAEERLRMEVEKKERERSKADELQLLLEKRTHAFEAEKKAILAMREALGGSALS